MDNRRDRSTGWKHAKLSGHENEAKVEHMFEDKDFCSEFSARLGIGEIKSASVGGLCETDVECVLGGHTKSKTDLVIELVDGSKVKISIKKSSGGQVYLIGVDRFVTGFEKQFSVVIPDDIKDSLKLYFYGHADTYNLLINPAITAGQTDQLINYQNRKGRLVWDSLVKMDKEKADRLLQWFRDNAANIAEYCFSRGLAKNSDDWADYVWYVNYLGEDDFDIIFSISDIREAISSHLDMVVPGKRTGGSTILMPFGFVQWHQKQMQFHHSLVTLCEIVENQR